MGRESLIDRIGEIQNLAKVTFSVRNALSVSHINPREVWGTMPYLKYDLVDKITYYLGNRDFSNNLYNSVNKDVLKRVYYGIRSTGEIPSEFLDKLTDWEKVYFFRGRWQERNPDLSESLLVLTSKHLYLGLNKLHEDHYKRKAKGKYKSKVKFPESDFIREDYWKIVGDSQNKIKKPEPVQLSLFGELLI